MPEANLEPFEPAWLLAWRRGWRNEGQRYFLTRFVMLRLLGLVYFVAFATALFQAKPLLGSHGLTPIASFLPRVVEHFDSRALSILRLPSLFWLSSSDGFITALSVIGLGFSAALALGYANGLLLLALWALHLSFVNVGQTWYNFGWEIQLCETGSLAVFLVPLRDAHPFPARAPPTPVIWLFRWLTLRIMLGAGLIKVRGDDCWLALSCLDYHFETQPVPGPFSAVFHHAPHWLHASGVAFNHVVELVAPFLAFGPRRVRHVAGAAMAAFQGVLILSGNLSYLNWLTLVPIVACFDDSLLCRLLPKALVRRAERAAEEAASSRAQNIATKGIFGVIALLSIFPVVNLLSERQAMNTSFNPLAMVNTYGAFGSVGRVRDELVIEGTGDETLGPSTVWKEYEFRCKPGDPERRPCWLTPYHYRLDWLMWFAAMGRPEQYAWSVHLVAKLLDNDSAVLGLLGKNPFPGAPPRFIRVVVYRYELVSPWSGERAHWRRVRRGLWLPALSRDDVRLGEFLASYGFR